MDNQISPKKKKSTFSSGTSPNNTSQLIKRSKIEDEEDEEVPLEDKEIRQEIPLSPSINFIDASMTESFESTKIKGKNKSNFFFNVERLILAKYKIGHFMSVCQWFLNPNFLAYYTFKLIWIYDYEKINRYFHFK